MEVIERKTAPQLHPVGRPSLAEPETYVLSNGVTVYLVVMGSEEVVRIEWVFHAGSWHQDKPLVAGTTARMLREGTKKRAPAKVANFIDRHGASLSCEAGDDHTVISLTCLDRFAPAMIGLVEEMVTMPAFPEQELRTTIANRIEALKVRMEQVDYLASVHFRKAVYGAKHPYGYFPEEEHYRDVSRSDLRKFLSHYGKPVIFICGRPGRKTIKAVEKHFGEGRWPDSGKSPKHRISPSKKMKISTVKEGAVQSAIMIGKATITKYHPDFIGLSILNTILGGYFSSRLMSNIRQERGLTYGIYSAVSAQQHGAVFYISAEVNKENTNLAVAEIYREMARLRDEPVSSEELSLVRNYILGSNLASVDGPFRTMDTVKGLILSELGIDYFYQLIEEVNSINPGKLQELAVNYFGADDLYEIIAG